MLKGVALPDPDPMRRLAVAAGRLPDRAAFSGLTAAWLHGIDVTPCDPIEATVAPDAGVSARAGIALRRSALSQADVVSVRGLTATSIVRTIADLCRTRGLVEAVVVADAALHARIARLEQLATWARANRFRRGIRNLRRVLELVEPAAESPMESRLRMLLVLGGLPRPAAQISIHNAEGRFVGRPDLYYPEQRLGIEYDGALHRDSLAADNRRQNALLQAGVRLLRFTAADVLGNPESVLRQTRGMMATSAGKSRFHVRNRATSAGRSAKKRH